MRARLPLSVLAAAILAAGTICLTSSAQDQSDKVEAIFNRIEEGKGSNLWDCARELEELGRGALEPIRKGMARADGFVRVAIGKVLYHHEFREESFDCLNKVMGGKNAAARRMAAELTASLVSVDKKLSSKQKREVADQLRKLVTEQEDDLSKVALWRGVYNLTEAIDARRAVRDLLEKTKRRDVKDDAALALAEMDAFIWAKSHLRELAGEPSERGRLARAYLKIAEMSEDSSRSLDRPPVAGKYDYKMLDEVIDKLKEHYHDGDKVKDDAKLVDAAARGILGSLDWYTAYYDEKAIEQLRKEELEGHYGGIGARVSMKKDKAGTAWLTIEEPIFSGPAYRAGLRSYDRITEIEGESTMNQEVSDLVRKMRGKPGADVKLKVYRAGWEKEKEFVIKREEIQLETTMSRMLPGQIGYVKYTTFGDLDDELKNKGANIETMVRELLTEKMKVLVLDLRGNSGGYLRTAKRIAGLFLEHDQIILTTKARGVVKETYKVDNKDQEGPVCKGVPMIVLVDGGSASASEILAGALQDHKRATLVGEKTFGKGSVQDLKALDVSGGKTAARITIAKWFLPSGKTVEGEPASGDKPAKPGGVEPDIKAAPADREFWKESEFERLRADGKVLEYVETLFKEHKALCKQLAEVDYADCSKYPGFDDMLKGVTTKAEKDEVRELVREMVRKKCQDDVGKAMYLDFQTDVVLQRGIVEACAKAGIDVKNIKEYGVFAAAPPKK
jgi:C-terminal peptidase prc